MIKRIIFLVESPFCQRDYDRYGINCLHNNGFEVEIWDLSAIIYSDINKEIMVPDLIEMDVCCTFGSLDTFKTCLSKLTPEDYIVCLVGYKLSSYKIYKEISKLANPYSIFMANALPLVQKENEMNILKRIINAGIKDVLNFLYLQVPIGILDIRSSSLVLAGGELSLSKSRLCDLSTEILWIHTLDYDIYLNEIEKPSYGMKRTAVFLDEFLPYHPDFIRMGIDPPVSPEKYYPKINRFFDIIDDKLKVTTVIAAHPRSDYDKYSNHFKNRQIISGETAKLIRSCDFVIAHSSTAINFAVLFKKPILFITFSSLTTGYTGPFIEKMAQILGKSPIDLDKISEINWAEELIIDYEAYHEYKVNFIKQDGTAELPFWQVFANYIKNLNNQ